MVGAVDATRCVGYRCGIALHGILHGINLMARKPDVRYWASRGAYCCWIAGKQYTLAEGPDDRPLGPTFTKAIKRFLELTILKDAKYVRDVVGSYLAWLAANRSANTHRIRAYSLTPFVVDFGDRTIVSVTRNELTHWAEDRSDKRNLIASLRAMFGWAIKRGWCQANPAKGIESPSPGSRGADAYLTPEQIAAIRESVQSATRDFIDVLYATGARPGEIRLARGCDFDPARGAIIHQSGRQGANKTGRKTGRLRVVLLSGSALEIVRRRVERFGNGYLFPSVRGGDRPKSSHSVSTLFRRLSRRVGFPVTAYSFRHTYATDWILAGRSVEVLAELIGSSPDVIRRHYQHLLAALPRLRDHLEGFR